MTTRMVLSLVALSLAGTVACSAEKTLDMATTGGSAPAAAVVAPDAGDETAPPPIGKMDFAENDFVESDRNRDPFRSYVSVFAPEPDRRVAQNQRAVVLSQYSIDELKLVAIVTGGEYPRAMMLDPNGKGWVIKRGDFVGRPEIVHIGGANGADYQLNWRVDKVRDGDIVFTREDPAQPGIPPASRVVSLHPESESREPRL
jgi:type IV pilus assembly protein PilP